MSTELTELEIKLLHALQFYTREGAPEAILAKAKVDEIKWRRRVKKKGGWRAKRF